MLGLKDLKKYFSGKKVLVTGHTGFKGSYVCVLLKYLGAKVYGYSLKPEKGGLYELLKKGIEKSDKLVCKEVFADIRDLKKITSFVKEVRPDYVLHMAAQPLVLYGYEEPRYTYEVNVMGTINLLEAVRKTYIEENGKPVSILNVTTDKVYENNDLPNYSFKEGDKLCGRDPYANSKSCSDIVTYAYNKSYFFNKKYFRVSVARAGNVIGGGDLNANRIIPDCYKAIKNKKDMLVRNPSSIRPYQYVLEPLILYLNIMALQLKDKKYEGSYNIGPDKKDCLTTEVLVKKFYSAWQNDVCEGIKVKNERENTIRQTIGTKEYKPVIIYGTKNNKSKNHEAVFLRLDNSLIKKVFNYKEIFKMNDTMKYTAKVYKDMLDNNNIYESILDIIKEM